MPADAHGSSPLGELEAEIMDAIWSRPDPQTVRAVMDVLNARAATPRAYTTYMTVMRRLSDKGLLERARVGRGDSYRAALSRESFERQRAEADVERLVDQFGDAALVGFARRLASLDPETRRELERLAAGG